jgi:hypothetical protein
MTSKLKKAAADAVREWCQQQGAPVVGAVRHIHPRAFVLGKAAPRCLIVSRPWQDSEPQRAEFDKAHPLNVLHTFDASLTAGMWCATAYVLRDGVQETVAVRFDA